MSVVEPGPVQTEFTTNIASNNTGSLEASEDADVDEMTKKLHKLSFDSVMKHLSKNVS